MKMKRVASLLLLSLIFGIFITGVSVAQAQDEDRFTVKLKIGALGLFRQGNDNIPLVTDSFAPGGNTLLNANDLNLSIAPGLDASVWGRYRMFGLEFRYFGIFEWSKSEGPVSSAGGAVVQYQTPIGNTAFPNNIAADYKSKIHNIEANLRWWPIDRLSILAGFRYLMLDENLTIQQDIGPGLNLATHEIKTENTLLGGQVGLEGTILRFTDAFFEGDELSFGGWAKGGYFNNNIKTDIAITQTGPSFSAKESDNKGTFLCEGALNVGYKITRNVAIDLRYQVLWIQNVGLAPEQVTHSDPFNGTASAKAQSVLYHGPWVGVVFSF